LNAKICPSLQDLIILLSNQSVGKRIRGYFALLAKNPVIQGRKANLFLRT